jgi:hypothetical protein
MYYFLTFRGSEITHYNLRFLSAGRENQVEIGARAGNKNQSPARFMLVRPGGKYTVAIQACNRGGFLEKSGCTGWYRITFYGPE